MTDALTCPQCDAELPSNAPAGICPRCLMQAALAGSSEENQPPLESPFAVTTPQPRSFQPPESGLLADYFPQLEIMELLGQGGMGAVYKARQPKLDRLVALKIIRPESADDPTFAERFNREAKTLARLSHPHIVGIHDFGEVTVSPGDGDEPPKTLYYFLMEYVDGANLRQLMEREELSPGRALSIVPQICEALQFAHDEGIVHRDIKPENILIDSRGRVKIADFGLAKLAFPSEQDFTLTGTHQVMGTPLYMAPEQMSGSRAVDHRADLYSLGVVFYEMLTGQIPAGIFDPPSRSAAIDVRLDDVVMKTLALNPEDRFQTANEFQSSLEVISRDESGAFLSEPQQLPARGFSTIFEREVGAAWNWVVHPERASQDSEKTESAAFPRLLFITLAFLGTLTMFLPWAEIQVDQGTSVSQIERGAELTKTVVKTLSGTELWSSAAAGGVCGLLGVVVLLIPFRRPPGIVLSGVLLLISAAAVTHSLAFMGEFQSRGSVTLPLKVSGQTARMLRMSHRDGAVEETTVPKPEVISYKVSLRMVQHRVQYLSGFFSALGLSIGLVLLNVITLRNAIMNREPGEQTNESWSGTPLASLRFQVPVKGEIGSKIKFHFLGMGYELADEQPGTWIFQRGTVMGGMMQEDIRAYPTRLSIHSIQEEDGGHLVNCHWSVRLMGGWAGKKDIGKVEEEGRELESLLRGSSTPLDESSNFELAVESAPALLAPLALATSRVEEIEDTSESENKFVGDRSQTEIGVANDAASGPAIGMMLVGFLMIVGHGIAILNMLGPDDRFIFAVVTTVPGILVGIAMLVGGIGLQGLRSRNWAQVGIIAGYLPLSPGWVLTLFISVWASNVLTKPQVKLAFLEKDHRRRDVLKRRTAATKDGGIDFVAIEEELSGPSIALMTVGLLIALGHLTLFIFSMLLPYDREMALLAIPGFLIGIGMLVGGLHMHQMWSRGWAQVGMIAGFIPASAGWLISFPISIWARNILARPDVKAAFLERKRQRRGEVIEAQSSHEEIDFTALEEEVNGPSLAMIIVGGLIVIGHIILLLMCIMSPYDRETAAFAVPGLFVGIAMSVGGFLLRRFGTSGWTQLGIIAGMLPINAGWLISLPICIWANTVFHRRDVKQAFLETRRRQSQIPKEQSVQLSQSPSTNVPVGILVVLLIWSAFVGIGGIATYSWLRGELSSTYIEDRRAGTLTPKSGAYQQITVRTLGVGTSKLMLNESDVERTHLKFHLTPLRFSESGGKTGVLTIELPDLRYTTGNRGFSDQGYWAALVLGDIEEWMGTNGVDVTAEGVREEARALFRIAEYAHQKPAHELVDSSLFTVTPGEIRGHTKRYDEWDHARYCLYIWLAGLAMVVLVSVVISRQRSHKSNDFGLKFLALSGTMIGLAFVLYVLRGGSLTESSQSQTSHATATAEQAPLTQETPPLHRAAYRGDLRTVKQQLDRGAGVNDKDPIYGQTPLMFAAGQGHASLAATLILLGADVNERDKQGHTALMFAVQNQQEPVRKAIEKLVEFSQIKDAAERKEKLRSLPGIDKRLIADLELDLAEMTIDPLAQDHIGESVLMKAVARKNLAYLRDAEYDDQVAQLQDKQGRTALMHAISLNNPEYMNQIHELNRQRLSLAENSSQFVSDYVANPMFDPRALSRADQQGETALRLAEKQGRRKGDLQIPADKLIRDEMQQLIDAVSRELELAELKLNLHKPLLELRGHAYLAIGEKDKAAADFQQAKETVTN